MFAQIKVQTLEEEVIFLRAENAELRRQLAERDARIAVLEAQVEKLTRMVFGKRSENYRGHLKKLKNKMALNQIKRRLKNDEINERIFVFKSFARSRLYTWCLRNNVSVPSVTT